MKKSFILYNDSLSIFKELTNEQAGILIKAIIDYNNDVEPELDQTLKIVFAFFKNQFTRDSEKWENVRNKRVEAGSKGGKQKVANASKSKQKVANVAVNVNVSDSVSVNANVKKEKTLLEKTFEEFLKIRVKIKKPATAHAIKLLKDKVWKLSEHNEAKAIELINQSIVNSYQDIYPLRQDNQKKEPLKTGGGFFDMDEKIIQGNH